MIRRTKTSKLDKTQKKEATKNNISDSKTFEDELDKNETVDFDLRLKRKKLQKIIFVTVKLLTMNLIRMKQ